MELPDYSEVYEAFARSGLIHTPAEAHGILCGLLAKETATPVDQFLQVINGPSENEWIINGESESLLSSLHEITRIQLQDPNLGLELLLPDDDEPIEARFVAACEWARGLVFGLAEQGITSAEGLPEDTADFYRDCLALAGNEYEIDDNSLENEELYMELQEFLRMGTLLGQEELQPIKAPPQVH